VQKARLLSILLALALCLGAAGCAAGGGDGETAPEKGPVKQGDVITFGSYEQDNVEKNGPEPIEWIVLKTEEGKALLVSKYALDCQPYNRPWQESSTWEKCSLRQWLNVTDFINSAFTQEERDRICDTSLTAESHPQYPRVDPGKDTVDKIFLLSLTDAQTYFADDSARRCAPTEYAKARGTSIFEDSLTLEKKPACEWWLRTPADHQSRAAIVDTRGVIMSNYIFNGGFGVRPAMWITIE